MKRRFFRIFFLSLLLLGIIFVLGCASTGGTYQRETPVDDSADIDELLGLTDDEFTDSEENAIDEDDILKLLGVAEEGEVTAQEEAGSTTTEQQIKNNEQKLADLDNQEQSISNIENRSTTPSTRLTQPENNQPDRESTPLNQRLTFEEKYKEALRVYNTHQYRTAIQKFEDLLMDKTNHQLSDNCQYWIGEAYYGLANYQQAIVAFEKVFSFTKSNKDDDAQLKLGLCHIRLNNKARAKEEFQKLINNYPTSEYVSIAKRYIK